MKLRLEPNILRFRVSQSEFEELLDGHTLNETVCLPVMNGTSGNHLAFHISPETNECGLALRYEIENIALMADPETLKNYAATLPNRVGLTTNFPNSSGAECSLVLEVDVRRPKKK